MDIHKQLWSGNDITLVQVDSKIFVCHGDDCASRDDVDDGWFRMVRKDSTWRCSSGCGYIHKTTSSSTLNEITFGDESPGDFKWWLSQWMEVPSKDIEVSIDE